jgi:hypothetical protein
VTQIGWHHLPAEGHPADRFPLDPDYAQAFDNSIWVTVGRQPIRNRKAAEYRVRWVDQLEQMAKALSLWRSPADKEHVLGVFDEAQQVDSRPRHSPPPRTADRERLPWPSPSLAFLLLGVDRRR